MAEREDHMKTEDKKKSPKELREDIARTRSDMDNTLSGIMNKFSAVKVKDKVREGARSIGRRSKEKALEISIFDRIKENPIPAVMAGAGLYLLFSRKTGDGEYISEKGAEVKEKAEEVSKEAKGKVYQMRVRTGEKAKEMKWKAREKKEQIKGAVTEKTEAAKGWFYGMIEDNPLAVVTAAFAIGSAIGLSLPETEKEREAPVVESAEAAVEEEFKEAA